MYGNIRTLFSPISIERARGSWVNMNNIKISKLKKSVGEL